MIDLSSHLRPIAARLTIPEPARSRVLLEIATDMEDLFQHLVSEGTSKEEAARQVEEQFDLSEEALRELARIHSSPLELSLDRISEQARSTWERVLLGLAALLVSPALGGFLLQPTLFRDASPLVFGLLGVLALGMGMGFWKAVTLFRPGKEGPSVPRRGLRALPALALFLLLLGLSGVWVELYRAALAIRSTPERALVFLVEWLQLASATMVVSLSGALLTALLWFFLETRAAHLEERAAAEILETPA